tara:strand:- start:145 stop:669 length:525 start_codon:yes stop_codon:yes gene_type:complete
MNDEIEVSIETQSFRIIPSQTIEISDAIRYLGAKSNGEYAVIEREDPRAVILVDSDGSMIIHGIANSEAATLIAEEALLRMGMSEKGLTIARGEVLASFSVGRAVLIGLASERFADAEHDIRLDALRINANRYGCTILLFSNGRGVVMGQSSRKVAEMAASFWISRLEDEGALA